MQQLTAHFCLGLLALDAAESSMGLTEPTQTCHTMLCPLRVAQQEIFSLWY